MAEVIITVRGSGMVVTSPSPGVKIVQIPKPPGPQKK